MVFFSITISFILFFVVLAGEYCREAQFPYCNKQILTWKNRRNDIQKVYKMVDADVLSLQEVDHADFHIEQARFKFVYIAFGTN